jgi:hypothetical protein
MSDYLAAQITIGGCISRALAPRLCKLICQTRLSLDWGEAPLEPASAEDLLAARRTIDGDWLLQLVDDDAPYGSFPDLEAFLIKYEIPFDRQTDSGHGYDGCLVTYRPDSGKTEWLVGDEQPAVRVAPLWELETQLQALVRTILKAPRNVSHHQAQLALSSLRQCVPPRPAALPTFEIGKSIGLRKAA